MMKDYDYLPYLPPIERSYREMSRKEAELCHRHLVHSIPERIGILRDIYYLVNQEELSVERASPSTLKRLTEWLFTQVQVRYLDPVQGIQLLNRLPDTIPDIHLFTDYDVDGLTYGKSLDVGIFVGAVLRHRHKDLYWDLVLKPKNHLYFHQTVLASPHTDMTLNLWNTTNNLIYRYVTHSKLRYWDELFQLWEDYLTNPHGE